MDYILVGCALGLPVIPGAIANYISDYYIYQIFLKSPLLEFIFSMLYLANMQVKNKFDKTTFGIGFACMLITFMPPLLQAGGHYLLYFITTLTASIVLYTFIFLHNTLYGKLVTKKSKANTSILFYMLSLIFLLVHYQNIKKQSWVSILLVLWFGFIILHLNVMAWTRGSYCNKVSGFWAKAGSFLYLMLYAYVCILFLDVQGTPNFLLMKSLFMLSNFLLALSGVFYHYRPYHKFI